MPGRMSRKPLHRPSIKRVSIRAKGIPHFTQPAKNAFLIDYTAGRFTDRQLLEKYGAQGLSEKKFFELTGRRPKGGS